MEETLKLALSKLTDIQRKAASWQEGPVLVLAGPGSGKTQVLTARIATLLEEGRDKTFRILALTFTNKAADEMKERVASFVPGLEGRALIATFHSFCGQVLRQHGVHMGISPDFTIYALDDDRKAVLTDALERVAAEGQSVDNDDVSLLGQIDRLKAQLIRPADCEMFLSKAKDPARVAKVYSLYEEELRANNALDFNSLIFETYQLFQKFPAIAARYRKSHPYWLIDEFQDTTDAQYKLIRAMAGEEFLNIFAVADDDQIIYQWNGASFRQIQRLQTDFQARVIQLPTNYRCPPAIVEAANRLVAYNSQRTESKQPLVAGKTELRLPTEDHIQLRVFDDADCEARGIAEEIASKGRSHWNEITVLGRTRTLLDGVRLALEELHIPAVISQRRDDFLSPDMRFLVGCLRQVSRPLDKRIFAALVDSFNRASGQNILVGQVLADSEASGQGYAKTWQDMVRTLKLLERPSRLFGFAIQIFEIPSKAKAIVDEAIAILECLEEGGETNVDLLEDIGVWRQLSREIGRHLGSGAPLEQFLQELQLRSKEPAPAAGSVTLMTVHAAKGREFDTVYLIGLAEDILPAFQSCQKGDLSPEMEEERRNCFVAITRAKECLILSRARKYRGWAKKPSRFLVEMGFESEL